MNGNSDSKYPPSQGGFREFCEARGLYFEPSMTSVFEIIARSVKLPSGEQRPFKGVIALLLRGPAGTGKTEITKAFAEYINARYIFYQCFPGSNEDDLLYNLIPDDSAVSGIRLLPGKLVQAVISSQKHKTVMVLDEFDKTRPQTDAFLLDFLQNCRITVNIHGELKELEGNPENLIVILTSNDERDFSEPLLRRVISIHFRHLPASLVKKILEEHDFSEDIVTLLTQLYVDTINAELQKPATIQELLQLGWAIEQLGQSADWPTLVRQFVVKYDDDWQKYKVYLQNREPVYQEEPEIDDNIVVEAYEEPQEEPQETKEVKPRMPKIKPRVQKTVNPEAKVEEIDSKVGAVIETNEDNYDTIVKETLPEPSDDPTWLGNFKVYSDFIVREGDIDFTGWFVDLPGDYRALLKAEKAEFRGFINACVDFREFIKEFKGKVKYYTKNLIRIVSEDYSIDKSKKTVIDVALLPMNKKVLFYFRTDFDVPTKSELENFKKAVVAGIQDFVKVILNDSEVAAKLNELKNLVRKYSGQKMNKDEGDELESKTSMMFSEIKYMLIEKLLKACKDNINTLLKFGNIIVLPTKEKLHWMRQKDKDGGMNIAVLSYSSWSGKIDRYSKSLYFSEIVEVAAARW